MASRETAAEVLHAPYEFSLTCLPVQWEQNMRYFRVDPCPHV